MLKKVFCFVLACAMVLIIAGCKKGNESLSNSEIESTVEIESQDIENENNNSDNAEVNTSNGKIALGYVNSGFAFNITAAVILI